MLEVGDKLPEIDLRFKSIKGIETINTICEKKVAPEIVKIFLT